VTGADARKPDADLVAAARHGAREPLAELISRHWDTAVFLATRVLGSPELARDAAQEAAIAAMTGLGELRSADRFGAWFCGIALNVARRWLRQLRPEIPGLPPDTVSPAPGPAEAAEAADVAARVRSAVAALPDGQRAAVLLFYLQGLSHREVAGELGISVGAVKSRLHQARGALAPVLAPIIGTPEEEPMPEPAAVDWADVSVSEVRAGPGDLATRQHVMILRERGDGGRCLPIWIGPAEVFALAISLESVEAPRPFTYQLAASLVQAAGSRLAEVRITRLTESVFYAAVIVAGPAGEQEVDARPSDAVNLALVTGAPTRLDSRLFEVATRAGAAPFEVRAQTLPVDTAQLAAEARERLDRMRKGPGGGLPGRAAPAP
jgi:RNA polymerase sigma factor (sigma-70 family)